jgi:hypothetical protein
VTDGFGRASAFQVPERLFNFFFGFRRGHHQRQARAAWAVKLTFGPQRPLVAAVTILLPYGLIYFSATYVARVEECAGTLRKLVRLRR